MKRLSGAAGRTFKALSVRNYRLYFVGQVVSVSGTWMQTVALALLVLSSKLHGTGVDVGIVTALQFLPMLLFGTWGGLAADRLDKRRLLLATQSSAAVLALILGLLTLVGTIRLSEVYVLATLLGFVNMFDNPARQSFVSEMVGNELLPNAVSLNSVLMNSARVIGPAIGGVLIYTVGFASCFLANAGSYVAVIVALAMMRTSDLKKARPAPKAKGQLREGFRYVWSTPELRDPLLTMAIVGIFAFNFTVTLPLLAKFSFHGGAGTYSMFVAAMGSGAIIGGLAVAHRSRPSVALMARIGILFSVTVLAVSIAPSQILVTIALVVMGIFSISFIATANATLQLQAEPNMRGRVMALYAIAFLGSTPIGAPLVGLISDASNPRVALAVGGVAALAASIPLATRYRRPHRKGLTLALDQG
ncbi:MAG: MFS transporter [Actinobacteria bacterium]|nr:MFS transporter [Actinomycetota bacterium]MCL5444752.1 MFS transporter [Actinomycetota bacterium]